MKKDAYYFPHFCNARSDRKIKRVLKDLGIEGYGIYFMLLEVLREQEGFKYPLSDIDLLADEFGTSESKVSVVISKYELFQVDSKENFFSIKQIYYLQPYIEKSERAREAANKRWKNANASTNALQMESGTTAEAMQVKETKPNESETNQSEENDRSVFLIPQLFEILLTIRPKYPKDETTDFTALSKIVEYIVKQEEIKGNPYEFQPAAEKVKEIWAVIISKCSVHKLFSSYSLKTISNNLQLITLNIQNESAKGFDYQKTGDLLNSFGD